MCLSVVIIWYISLQIYWMYTAWNMMIRVKRSQLKYEAKTKREDQREKDKWRNPIQKWLNHLECNQDFEQEFSFTILENCRSQENTTWDVSASSFCKLKGCLHGIGRKHCANSVAGFHKVLVCRPVTVPFKQNTICDTVVQFEWHSSGLIKLYFGDYHEICMVHIGFYSINNT